MPPSAELGAHFVPEVFIMDIGDRLRKVAGIVIKLKIMDKLLWATFAN